MTSQLASEVRPLAEIGNWDEEADVVVVGLGAAGACAAIEAADAGASVIVLERMSAGGGTSAQSGGLIYLGGGTTVQKACGFDDSPDEMFGFLMEACGPEADEAKMRLFCDESVAHFEWLRGEGVPFKESFYPEPSMEAPTDDCLVFTGGEDTHPWNQRYAVAARGHKPQTEAAAGGFLMQCLIEAIGRRENARIVCEALAQQLVVDEQGRVVGLIASVDGTQRKFGARGGVVLCAGGFVLDDAMVERHAPQVKRCSWRLSGGGDDGSGIRMGQGAGGAVARMDALECAIPLTPPRHLVRGIMVNSQGQRFINEDAYYGRIGQTSIFREEGRFFWIHDDDTYVVNDNGMEASFVADTIEELEDEMGLPEGALVGTVELYNRHAERGSDPLFHKTKEFLKPLTSPPYGAIDCTVGKVLYATFTLGGLVTDVEGRVLGPDEQRVEGLYAAGRTTSGLAAYGYVSGISLADGTYFGRRAGRAAAGK